MFTSTCDPSAPVMICWPTTGIATIATILSMNGISMKNIGILHNREFEDGVLKIEFYDEDALAQATEQLKKRNYIIYER